MQTVVGVPDNNKIMNNVGKNCNYMHLNSLKRNDICDVFRKTQIKCDNNVNGINKKEMYINLDP